MLVQRAQAGICKQTATRAPSMPEPAPTPPEPAPRGLSHVQSGPGGGSARMVDVGAKSATERSASARASVRFPPGVLERALAGAGPKGPIEEVARVAGIQAAKRTSEWIPLCHPLPLDHVEVRFVRAAPDVLEVHCSAACTARTGVEMEALVGASAAALCVYDMCKALSKEIAIERIELLAKAGGESGPWRRAP
jgi:cyclic pyranopterin phosphate synthase